jgi:hypothetical protein
MPQEATTLVSQSAGRGRGVRESNSYCPNAFQALLVLVEIGPAFQLSTPTRGFHQFELVWTHINTRLSFKSSRLAPAPSPSAQREELAEPDATTPTAETSKHSADPVSPTGKQGKSQVTNQSRPGGSQQACGAMSGGGGQSAFLCDAFCRCHPNCQRNFALFLAEITRSSRFSVSNTNYIPKPRENDREFAAMLNLVSRPPSTAGKG